MLLRFCQLKSLALLLVLLLSLSACTWRKATSFSPMEFISSFSNKWFSKNSDHALLSSEGPAAPHLFIDTTPEFNQKDRTVNVIIATPKDSAHMNGLDLNSGQLHYTHSFCDQKDIWSRFKGSINKPSFSIGYIPRVLDQLGSPQKIMVWSNRHGFAQTHKENYFKVKIIGAFVENICPAGNCIGKNNWIGRLVFIGVDTEDPTLAKLNYVVDFKKLIDWDKAKAELENVEGKNSIGDQLYPYVRIGKLFDYIDAFDYFKKRSIFLTDKSLKRIQKSCHSLYDKLWDDVGAVRPEDAVVTSPEEIKKKAQLIDQLKKAKKPVGFAARLAVFTKKYFNEVSTCEKFVYHGNINKDPNKFWFESYLGIYFRLHREGYFFNCQHKTWQRNVIDRNGKPIYDLKEEVGECNERDIDLAMEYLPNFLKSLTAEKEYFRFVDYDNHSFGTHKKLYTWIKMRTSRFDCSNDPNPKFRNEIRLFPEDISWSKRQTKDLSADKKIIY